jgi:hypothetical protein
MMQSPSERAAADARVLALAGRRTAQAVFVGCGLTVIFTVAILLTAFITTSEDGVRALATDYRVFWGAARLALQGEFLATFDMARLAAVHNVQPEEWMPWLYPPGYLFLIAPFGIPSYAVSFLIATLISAAAIAWAVRPFVAGSTTALWAFALAPAYLPALLLGQNTLIWFAVLLVALAALRDGRWTLAGICIGCLTLKPQLGLMIPVALLAAGHWRVILAASVTAVLLALIPTLIVGLDYWPLFLERLDEQGDRLIYSIRNLDLMVGSYYLFVQLGLTPDQGLVAQALLALISAASVFLVWRNDTTGFDAKVAVLLTAIFLSAPYLWYYEAAIMALAGLFMLRAGILRRTVPHLVLLAVLWFGAGLQAMNIFVDLGNERFPWAFINTPTMVLCLILCLAHYLSSRRVPVQAV